MKESLKEDLKDLTVEKIESLFDKIIEHPVVNTIDFAGIFKLLKAARSVRDIWYLDNIKKFLFELESIDKESVISALRRWNKSEEEKEKVGKNLLMIIERIKDEYKPRIVALVFFEYLKGEIKLEKFLRILHGIDLAFYEDLISESQTKGLNLLNTGLVYTSYPTKKIRENSPKIEYTFSPAGRTLFHIILKDKYKDDKR